MAVPVIIFVACFAAGVYASSRWLPELAPGPVGSLAFFSVCGLLSAALAVFGLNVYDLVETLSRGGIFGGGRDNGVLLASGLESILFQSGVLSATALGIYLLAPPPPEPDPAAVAVPPPA